MSEGLGAALWAVRMLLLSLGVWLTARGIGDAELWGGLANNIAGPIVWICAGFWSYRARQAQLAHVPGPGR